MRKSEFWPKEEPNSSGGLDKEEKQGEKQIQPNPEEGGQNDLRRKEHHRGDRGEEEEGHPEEDPEKKGMLLIVHRHAPGSPNSLSSEGVGFAER